MFVINTDKEKQIHETLKCEGDAIYTRLIKSYLCST